MVSFPAKLIAIDVGGVRPGDRCEGPERKTSAPARLPRRHPPVRLRDDDDKWAARRSAGRARPRRPWGQRPRTPGAPPAPWKWRRRTWRRVRARHRARFRSAAHSPSRRAAALKTHAASVAGRLSFLCRRTANEIRRPVPRRPTASADEQVIPPKSSGSGRVNGQARFRRSLYGLHDGLADTCWSRNDRGCVSTRRPRHVLRGRATHGWPCLNVHRQIQVRYVWGPLPNVFPVRLDFDGGPFVFVFGGAFPGCSRKTWPGLRVLTQARSSRQRQYPPIHQPTRIAMVWRRDCADDHGAAKERVDIYCLLQAGRACVSTRRPGHGLPATGPLRWPGSVIRPRRAIRDVIAKAMCPNLPFTVTVVSFSFQLIVAGCWHIMTHAVRDLNLPMKYREETVERNRS